ncbi:MAG: hypothetical protein A2W05_06450 [Candidatus Schekmanbacteria bacterium RBG_16_38_10]|uniref:SPOR domain-containing protein n=1 Tax=Candidatus Schekmanbacteria bacterium RBG_16_38_10 TaxID=1817879 RepID=A0A1F7RTX9_9BACT|nr:MAG: hypothetical protein A2W05_06450 [Candidatus Schekmanbacteria bacterium RBG_16_38_10]
MYTLFYNLTKKPFENTPDPDFLYLSNTHREALASLVYGIEAGKGFVLLAGDVGTGKTTVIHALQKRIDPSFLVINIINPNYSFDEIIKYLSSKLDVSIDGTNGLELIEIIRQRLEAMDKDGKRCVIIVDEAHHLSENSLEELRLISNIEGEKQKLIQIILVGQIELYRILQRDSMRQVQQRIVINRVLGPLNKDEVKDYIRFRLNIAGNQKSIFDEMALNLIWKKSKGIPRVINQLCDNAMVIGFALDAKIIGINIVREAIKDMESGQEYITGIAKTRFDAGHRQSVFVMLPIILALVIGGSFIYAKFYRGQKKEIIASENNAVYTILSQSEGSYFNDNDRKLANTNFESLHEIAVQSIPAAKENISHSVPEETLPEQTIPDISTVDAEIQHNIFRPVDTVHNKHDESDDIKKKVLPNEYLIKMATDIYGISNDTVIDLIHMANPGLKNVNKIFPDKNVVFPKLNRKDMIVKGEDGGYYIHFASFYRFDNAKKEVDDLFKDNNERIFLITVLAGEHLVYRIYIGIFKDYIAAEEKLGFLKLKYLPFL